MHSQGNGSQSGPKPGMTTRSKVSVNVTPLFQQGNVVACDIMCNAMNGGSIKLEKAKAYTLEFNLTSGAPAGLKFRANKQDGSCDAFWSDPNDCPHNQTNAAGYAATRQGDSLVSVDVNAPGQDACVYYRLNFENGRYFDPVIIHK